MTAPADRKIREIRIERILRADVADPKKGTAFEAFARAFVRRAGEQYLSSHAEEYLVAELRDAFRFVNDRRPDELKARLFVPNRAEHGFEIARTILETCVPDQPFLVDSLRLFLKRHGLRELACVHPILSVARDADGRILSVDASDAQALPESFIHFETERIDDARRLRDLLAEVGSLLGTLRDVCQDFRPMLAELARARGEIESTTAATPEELADVREAVAFLDWLRDDNFVLLGYRRYRVEWQGDTPAVAVEREGGLGICRRPQESRYARGLTGDAIPAPARSRLAEPGPVVIEKANAESQVHRSGKLDHVGVKVRGPNGRVAGYALFLGLYTFQAIAEEGSRIPILRRKLHDLLKMEGHPPGTHLYKATVAEYNSIPVEYLFAAPLDGIADTVRGLVAAESGSETRVHVDPDRWGRSTFVSVIIPREKYSEELRAEIQERLTARLGATYADYRVAYGEGDATALYFYLTGPVKARRPLDPEELSREVLAMTWTWEERLLSVLSERLPEAEANRLHTRYARAFSEQFKLATEPWVAYYDIEHFEALDGTGELQVGLLRDRADLRDGTAKLRLFSRSPLGLADLLPILDHFGLRVIDQLPTEVPLGPGKAAHLNSFRIEDRWKDEAALEASRGPLAEGLRAVLGGRATSDALNRLIVQVGVSWREAAVFRAFVDYLAQLGSAASKDYASQVLSRYPKAASSLLRYFQAKFDPQGQARPGPLPEAELKPFRDDVLARCSEVETAGEDRVIRRFLNLADAIARTNYYRVGAEERPFAFKLDPALLEEMPSPRPWREIFVHGASVEGVHLRGGAVARGGIRWSDRNDDYRTEVFGLMRTQMVKNVIIVPVGAKGGFVLKGRVEGREARRAEADTRYREFIRALLELTDNILDGVTIHPERTRCYDGEDPYLVVAADKGTAHLSDTANRIAEEMGFWLGDAFASGGRTGYDHKKEGITAKGGFACVRRRFLDAGRDPLSEEARVVGVGDMSGDVFGNFFLQSPKLKLVGAFSGEHVFLDPEPVQERAVKERERLFSLPRSTWGDYDPAALGPGGGVFARSAREIPLSREAQRLLGVKEQALSGEAIVGALLRAEVDLIWNGGIGTYVKASQETHAAVGDRANDAVRVDGRDVRAKVVGEGGNLGVTPAGRVEIAITGGRIDADFIDNSGGVDLSDHEVNLKILFAPLLRSSELALEQRDKLLREVCPDVCAAVIRDNADQALMLSVAAHRSPPELDEYQGLIRAIVHEQGLDPVAAALPSKRDMARRRRRGHGMLRPELAVLAAQVKMDADRRVQQSELPEDPLVDPLLASYFPATVAERFPEAIRRHRLRREIAATAAVNETVNAMGPLFLYRMRKDLAAQVPDAVRAYLIARAVLDEKALRATLLAAERPGRSPAVYAALAGIQDAVDAAARWLVAERLSPADPATLIATRRKAAGEIAAVLPDLQGEREANALAQREREYLAAEIPADVARRAALMPALGRALDIAHAAEAAEAEVKTAARAYLKVGELVGLSRLARRIAAATRTSEWDAIGCAMIEADLREAHARVTAAALKRRSKGQTASDAVKTWIALHEPQVDLLEQATERLLADRDPPVVGFTVIGYYIRQLTQSA